MNEQVKNAYEKIKMLCEKLDNADYSEFSNAATMEELDLWQKENGVVLPENYKEWLLLSKYSYIAGGVLELFMPSKNGYYGQLVPEEFIVVGNVIGDGERMCFDVNMGEFVRYDHGYIREVGDFTNILNWAIEYLEIMLEAVNDKIRFVFRNDLLRRKAIQGFWIHERELLNNGRCTRQWNGDEIEAIYNINLDTGNKRIYAGKPVQYKNGEKLTENPEAFQSDPSPKTQIRAFLSFYLRLTHSISVLRTVSHYRPSCGPKATCATAPGLSGVGNPSA